MRIAILLSFLFVFVIPYSLAQSCGDATCDSGETPESCPQDCGAPDKCRDVRCESNSLTCPDGFVSSCSNTCDPATGACSSCTPSCEGHDKTSCGNGVCDNGETPETCSDCYRPSCGDAQCDGSSGENSESCPKDCGESRCGDAHCENGETRESCPADCFESICGDAQCDSSENTDTCPNDCKNVCPDVYQPVCGADGVTYSNDCFAKQAGATIQCGSECPCPREGEQCPESITCPDGSLVSCRSDEGFCDCKCPLPEGCTEVRDESGFVHVACGNEGPRCIPPRKEDHDVCREKGGVPSLRKAPDGCDIFECRFGSEPGDTGFFQRSASCPPEDVIRDTLKKCEELGSHGIVDFKNGCKVAFCSQGREFICAEEQNPGIRGKIEEECSAKGLEVRKNFDRQGCPITVCDEGKECLRAIPEEAYKRCEGEGGEMISDTQNGCVSFARCVMNRDKRDIDYERVEKVPEKSDLLQIAFKMEELKIKLFQLSDKLSELATFYEGRGDSNAERFKRASAMAKGGADKIDEIRAKLRDRLGSLSIEDVEEIKYDIKSVADVLLNDILYIMLGSDDNPDIQRIKTKNSLDCGKDERCFSDALIHCEPTQFFPSSGPGEPSPDVELQGVDDKGNCILYASMSVQGRMVDMTCTIPADVYPLGLRDPEKDIFPYCSGSMVDAMNQFDQEGPPSGPGGCRGDDDCEEYCREHFEECRQWCEDNPGRCPPEAFRERPSEDFRDYGYDEGSGFYGEGEFGENPSPYPGDFGSENCVGCLNNGVCDQGECMECKDCAEEEPL